MYNKYHSIPSDSWIFKLTNSAIKVLSIKESIVKENYMAVLNVSGMYNNLYLAKAWNTVGGNWQVH